MNSTVKTVLFWVLIIVSAVLLWQVVKSARDGQKDTELNVSQFMSDVDQGTIRELTVNGMEVRGKHKDGSAFHTTAPSNYFTPEMLKSLQSKGVNITFAISTVEAAPSTTGYLGSADSSGRAVVLHDPADADGRQQGALVRQEPSAAAFDAAEESYVQGRGGRGRG